MTKTPKDPADPKTQPISPNTAPAPSSSLTGVNLSDLRLSQDFASQAGVKKAILTIPVRKPGRQTFVRVRSGEQWRFQTALLTLKEEREV